MTAKRLEGTKLAESWAERVAREVRELRSAGVAPNVVAICNDESPASAVYRRRQEKACREAGIGYEAIPVSARIAERELHWMIHGLNADASVTGVTVHLPLPGTLDARRVLLQLRPEKDVESHHPHNLGMLSFGPHDPSPCAARAAVELARTVHPSFKGLDVTVVGHSDLIGKPIAAMLLQSRDEAATPTICHVATRDLASHTLRADVLFVAAGKPGLVRGDMIREGATVVDIGINEVSAPETAGGRKSRLVGDVDFEGASKRAAWVSPVPGGVGPLTIAVLLHNVVACARRLNGLEKP